MVPQQSTQPPQGSTDEREHRFPHGFCRCQKSDPCGCDGTRAAVCPCYRHEWEQLTQQSDSVCITPAMRERVLQEHYRDESIRQHAAAVEARTNRDSLVTRYRSNPESVRPYQIDEANRQLTAARTVDQYVHAVAVAYGNRDF
jgi:hypothetical protein